jgi:DNA-binding NarL/FixJ family response regulator
MFILRIDPELEIIGEAGSGDEALTKAEQLAPGVILLDIGLPGMSGVEVCRRMLRQNPKNKIIFLTQETNAEVVCEALRIGASAFVAKIDAASQLVTAIRSAVNNKVFLSRSVPPTLGTIQ